MKRTGVHHLGLATLDLDRTVEFYTTKLGWEVAWADIIETAGGGKIKHVFLNTGDGSLVAFMCPEKVPGLPRGHGNEPAGERRDRRVLEDHHIGKQKADRADEVQRLIDSAVVVVAMIVPALRTQSLAKIFHRSPRRAVAELGMAIR